MGGGRAAVVLVAAFIDGRGRSVRCGGLAAEGSRIDSRVVRVGVASRLEAVATVLGVLACGEAFGGEALRLELGRGLPFFFRVVRCGVASRLELTLGVLTRTPAGPPNE